MNLAFNSRHPYVPNLKDNPNSGRWIASLSDGSTIFEDVTPHEKSAWLRLRDYIETHRLKITNLRLEAYGRNVVLVPYKSEDGVSQINGYWHSKVITALLCERGVIQSQSYGIGILKGRDIWITWVLPDGSIKQEFKTYDVGNLAAIVNDEP